MLPVVDLSLPDAPAGLLAAAHDVGFCYVSGHGVPADVTTAVFAAARAFFALEDSAKLEIENVRSPQFRGYTRVGQERTGGRPDRREQLDIGRERPPRDLTPGDPAYLRLDGPNQWPAAQPGLRPVTLAWQEHAERVSRAVLRALAAALGQDAGYFDRWFDADAAPHQKIIRYPGRVDDDQGVGVHKDYGWLALLQQDDLGGLQVEAADGSWIDAAPLPGTFVVNIGEMLEIATRGYLRATRHRVLSPPPGRDRISVAYFFAPRLTAVVEPLDLPPGLVAPGVSQDPANPLFATYGENALRGWLRSHPAVAERWWSDVLAARA